jgi:ABC-type transport system involved in multi-copper enzyme maturation permease subunit
MNSFIAMLKDSIREAIDGWIFLVMLVLSAILILLVGSISVTPVTGEKAIERMLVSSERQQLLSPDRGKANKFAIFLFQANPKNFKASNEKEPWKGTSEFELEFTSTGFGPAGAEVELDENKQPKVDAKKAKDSLMMGDAFKEAVRYWASVPGEKKPAFSEELAKEFVKEYVADHTRFKVSEVIPIKNKPAGMFDNILTSGPNKFLIKCESGEVIGWTHQPALFFGLLKLSFYERPLGTMINTLESTLLNGFGAWILLLAGVIVTASFIPNMIRKGAIDLLLTKPMSRPAILLYKYFGGLMFVFLLTIFTILGVWLMVGLRTGVWATGVLFAIGGITGYFAILYSCSTLLGVLTRNTIVAIVGTIVFWFVVFLIGFVNTAVQAVSTIDQAQRSQRVETRKATKEAEAKKKEGEKQKDAPKKEEKEPAAEEEEKDQGPFVPEWLTLGMKWLNRVTPRTGDLDTLTQNLIAKDLMRPSELKQTQAFTKDVELVEVSIVAGLWLCFFLGLALLRFVTRSY